MFRLTKIYSNGIIIFFILLLFFVEKSHASLKDTTGDALLLIGFNAGPYNYLETVPEEHLNFRFGLELGAWNVHGFPAKFWDTGLGAGFETEKGLARIWLNYRKMILPLGSREFAKKSKIGMFLFSTFGIAGGLVVEGNFRDKFKAAIGIQTSSWFYLSVLGGIRIMGRALTNGLGIYLDYIFRIAIPGDRIDRPEI